jgi:hypothetical protein
MDLASSLIRTVARAFYETRHILVIDALFIHSVYPFTLVNGSWDPQLTRPLDFMRRISLFSLECSKKISASFVAVYVKTV